MIPKRLLRGGKEYFVQKIHDGELKVSVASAALYDGLWNYTKTIGMMPSKGTTLAQLVFRVAVPAVADANKVAEDIRSKAEELCGDDEDEVIGIWRRKNKWVTITHRGSAPEKRKSCDGAALEVDCDEEWTLERIVTDLRAFGIDTRVSAIHPLKIYVYPKVDLEELTKKIIDTASEHNRPF